MVKLSTLKASDLRSSLRGSTFRRKFKSDLPVFEVCEENNDIKIGWHLYNLSYYFQNGLLNQVVIFEENSSKKLVSLYSNPANHW